MNRFFLSVASFALLCIAVHSQNTENVANSQQFSLNPNDLGALKNSVNLMTGQVGFPMTLASLQGRGGLNPQVTLSYSSAGIQEQVNTWNRTAPTGIVGLGWTFDYPRIVSEHQGTVARDDDTYYLIDNGTSIELICTDSDVNETNHYRTYKPRDFRKWTIKFYYSDDIYGDLRWVVTTEAGLEYHYATPQHLVAWGNWIGTSAKTTGQSQHEYAWNLTEIVNRWGDAMTFSYLSEEEAVGNGGMTHTKSSLLERIESPTGNYLQLIYADKTYESCTKLSDYRCTDRIREYQDPHVESSEPDAYQEKYTSKYLAKVAAYHEEGDLLYEVVLDYSDASADPQFVGEGEMAKRLLTGIRKIQASGDRIPATRFDYDLDEFSPTKGYLNRVENSIGGIVSFDYTTVGERLHSLFSITKATKEVVFEPRGNLSFGDRDIKVTAPEGFETPSLYFGPDYVAVLWRNTIDEKGNFSHGSNETYLEIYQWEGEWVKYDMGRLAQLRSSEKKNRSGIYFTAQADFFGLFWKEEGEDDYFLSLFHKKTYGVGWHAYQVEIVNFETKEPQHSTSLDRTYFMSGTDYVAFSNYDDDRLIIFNWDGEGWRQVMTFRTGTGNGGTYTASNNYIASVSNQSGNEKIQYLVKNETGDWNRFQVPDALSFSSNGSRRDRDGSDLSYIHAGPSYFILMADGTDEFYYYWDENYENIRREVILESPADSYPVLVTNNSFGIDFSDRIFYFQLLGHGEYEMLQHNYSEDDGNIKEGNLKIVSDACLVTERKLDDIFLYDFNFKTQVFDRKVEELDGNRKVEIMPNTAVIDDEIFYREPNGRWGSIQQLDMTGYGDRERDMSVAPPGLIFNSVPYTHTDIYAIINGRAKHWKESRNMDNRHDVYSNRYYQYQTSGPYTFATFSRFKPKHEVTNFRLYRYSAQEIEDDHALPVVKSLHINDGYLNLTNAFEYDLSAARMSVNSRYPLFNKVKVVNGSADADHYPQGYTVTYFYNGKDFSSLLSLPAEQATTLSFETALQGQAYRSEMYDNTDQLVGYSETIYELYTEERTRVYQVRPTIALSYSIESNGTISSRTETTYNEYGMVTQSDHYNHADKARADIHTRQTYTYYWEEYGPEIYADSRDFHLYSEVIASKRAINGQLVEHTATVWNSSATETTVKANYYKRNLSNAEDFSAWRATRPSPSPAIWRLGTQINTYDSKGNVLESEDHRGEKTCTDYDQARKHVLISAAYAESDQVAYTSFEPGQQVGWTAVTSSTLDTEAFTGSYAGTSAIQAIPEGVGGKFDLFFWYKGAVPVITFGNGTIEEEEDIDTRQGWTLRKVRMHVFSNYVRVDPNGSKIDEVRLHPRASDVVTRVYDERDRLIAETDANLITTFYEYDALDRRKVVRDMDGVIRSMYSYGFKETEE